MRKIINIREVGRREFGQLLGLASAGLLSSAARLDAQEFGIPKTPDPAQKRVNAVWRYVGAVYYFDPFGLYVEPGDTVEFYNAVGSGRAPTITAYHPEYDNRELRIPDGAQPFHSVESMASAGRAKPGFTIRFDVPGTYDYFSKYEEWAGMVGRVVVGKPGGPGEKPWGYGNIDGRRVVPPKVKERAKLLDSNEIVKRKSLPFPFQQFTAPYPLW
jgi:plastocyanin